MNAGERLLDRIRSSKDAAVQRAGDTDRRCQASVLSHLQRILNTRRGNVPIAEDYGIPDFVDFLQSYPESVHKIERDIKATIDKYEPRLGQVLVTHVPDVDEGLTLRFQIVANLRQISGYPGVEQDRPVRKVFFKTLISENGRVHIRR